MTSTNPDPVFDHGAFRDLAALAAADESAMWVADETDTIVAVALGDPSVHPGTISVLLVDSVSDWPEGGLVAALATLAADDAERLARELLARVDVLRRAGGAQ